MEFITQNRPLPGTRASNGRNHTIVLWRTTRVQFDCRSGREKMADARIELPQGTLDLLILKTVALEPQHGWAISERVQQISSEVLQVRQGSLYPALHRL